MRNWKMLIRCGLILMVLGQVHGVARAEAKAGGPAKVYVPYERLKDVFEAEKQGVFLPYDEFQRLWRAAEGDPAGVREAPTPYLISTARFTGKVGAELASMRLELTVDILSGEWVQVPIGLAEVAVAEAQFLEQDGEKPKPLLRVVDGEYILLTKGMGRRVLQIDFVRQLVKKPGLQVLSYRTPSAAITTLALIIPDENMKVDVEPMLAATTSQVEHEGGKATRLMAFLGSADRVKLSWKPRTQAAAELEPVIIANQMQHIHVAEALVSHEVKFTYDIRRRGVDGFSIHLPADFRVTSVDGANIARWDIEQVAGDGATRPQLLKVRLFSRVKDGYALTVKMERFLKESRAEIALSPILTQQVLRRTGLVAISHSRRRSVELREVRNLARVDTGRLPKPLRDAGGVMAYRFITADYRAAMVIETVDPRISVHNLWSLGVSDYRVALHGRMNYRVDRAGVYEVKIHFPEPWTIASLGPDEVVDEYELEGQGDSRTLNILLKKELSGSFGIDVVAHSGREKADQAVDFRLPLPDVRFLRQHTGKVVLMSARRFSAEVAGLEQLQPIPMRQARDCPKIPGTSPAMAFEFRALDGTKPAGAKFNIAVKPTQVSAVVHRLIDVQLGSIRQEAVINYRILYAPVDELWVKMPASLADGGVQITGRDIKEKPRFDRPPPDDGPEKDSAEEDEGPIKWAYYKIVLQSGVIGEYSLTVQARRKFPLIAQDSPVRIAVEPILAAGKLSDQSGHIAIAKADTLAIVKPETRNLTPADPSGKADLPHEPHRKVASLAFKYGAPPFELAFGAIRQKEAAVITTMASGAIIEQVLARDGALNAHAIFLLQTRRGDRLPVTLPAGAELLALLVNSEEAPVELGSSAQERIVRLPLSAGEVTKIVLEVSYSLNGASAGTLAAPRLPDDVPVQQMLWRVWLPEDLTVLGFDRDFARLTANQSGNMVGALGAGQPSPVAFKLHPQGRRFDFIRQGAGAQLSITAVATEWFSVIVWVLIAAAGAAMLKLSGFARCIVILAAFLAAAVVRLFAPLLVQEVYRVAWTAAVLVILLWIAHWGFFKLRRKAPPPTSPEQVEQGEPAVQTEQGTPDDTEQDKE